MKFYKVYGLVIGSEESLEGLPECEIGQPLIELKVRHSCSLENWNHFQHIFQSHQNPISQKSDTTFEVWKERASSYRIKTQSNTIYDISHDNIVVYVDGGHISGRIEAELLSSILTVWLEWHQRPVLHASAITTERRAAAFLAHSGSGKSTLAMSMLNLGCQLLTDDLLPIFQSDGHFWGESSYPQIRLWPTEVGIFRGSIKRIKPIDPSVPKLSIEIGTEDPVTFCTDARYLACIYILKRLPPDKSQRLIKIKPISMRQSVIELLRYSFMPRLVHAMGLSASRLELFTHMVQLIPFREIQYPSDLKLLQDVSQAILQDFYSL